MYVLLFSSLGAELLRKEVSCTLIHIFSKKQICFHLFRLILETLSENFFPVVHVKIKTKSLDNPNFLDNNLVALEIEYILPVD